MTQTTRRGRAGAGTQDSPPVPVRTLPRFAITATHGGKLLAVVRATDAAAAEAYYRRGALVTVHDVTVRAL